MKAEQSISSSLQEQRKFPPSEEFSRQAHISSFADYRKLYDESIREPDLFWAKEAERLDWFEKWHRVSDLDMEQGIFQWFPGGKLNVSYNCLDRHVESERAEKTALIWQGEPEDEVRTFTYKELHREVCKLANVLLHHGVKKGDRVAIYLPMVPELMMSLLACSRIGAVHSVIFGGFSANSIRERILDSTCKMVITADGGFRGGKEIFLKEKVDEAVEECACVEKTLVLKRTGTAVSMEEGRDFWWHEEMEADYSLPRCPPEPMDAEDPLFILYTSGSTGKPKGVLHTTGGYLTYAAATSRYIFDLKDEDIFWCTADIGWITGHSYVVYGPLANGATVLMFEGVPNYPQPDRFWEVVEKFKVTIFYTAPTAIRAILKEGDRWPQGRDLSSLRLLGTVGEPINPEVWVWYHQVIGGGRCPVVDTWWQTETGGILISPLPGAVTAKPGSATVPFFGVEPLVIREDGTPCEANEGGYLVIKRPWPGIMRTLYNDHRRFVDTYFSKYPGYYFTGDGARVDEEGYFWLMGRVDDVINVSGHRIGTAEVESALVSHKEVAEAAVVGHPHPIKGEGIFAFVILKNASPSDEIRRELVNHVRRVIGPIATPDELHFINSLPKTRSGKIMRRILKSIATGNRDLGDTTTLADPGVVKEIIHTVGQKN